MADIKVRYNGAQRYTVVPSIVTTDAEVVFLPKISRDKEKKVSKFANDTNDFEIYQAFHSEELKDNDFKRVQVQKASKLMRLYRYRMKGLNSDFNYFCTITYDDKKCTEQAFHDGLLKYFKELKRNNKDFRYIGAFERGNKTERLHFHAIVNIATFAPQMVIKHNLKKHVIHEHACHPYFYKKFGLCDFKSIDPSTFDYPHTIRYITKYLLKDEGFCEIHLSRGIKDHDIIDDNQLRDEYTYVDGTYIQSSKYWHKKKDGDK